MYLCTHTHTLVYVYAYVHVFMYTHTHTHTHTDDGGLPRSLLMCHVYTMLSRSSTAARLGIGRPLPCNGRYRNELAGDRATRTGVGTSVDPGRLNCFLNLLLRS